MPLKTLLKSFSVVLLIHISTITLATTSPYQQLFWLDLMPKADRERLENIDSFDHEGDEAPPQLDFTTTRSDLINKPIRIAGFIVPLEVNEAQELTELFFVPYVGACIHVPPPPANQMIYVKYPQGLDSDDIYQPYWLEGTLSAEGFTNDIAHSAYTMTADTITAYIYEEEDSNN